jgi:Ca2+-binding EF-hand superfamily protein
MFNIYDQDDDGMLSFEEWKDVWAYVLSKEWDEEDSDDIVLIEFRKYDDDNDWIMTIIEFEAFYLDRCALCPQDSAAILLAEFDSNSDGLLDVDEWRALWNYVDSLDDGSNLDPVEEDFKLYDDNNDGIMTYLEFKAFFDDRCALCPETEAETLLSMYDMDQDGVLNWSEWKVLWAYVDGWEDDEDLDPCEIDFKLYDDENDGIMTLEEFKHFFEDRCALCPYDYAEDLLAMYDYD